jgi:hypothetical protein
MQPNIYLKNNPQNSASQRNLSTFIFPLNNLAMEEYMLTQRPIHELRDLLYESTLELLACIKQKEDRSSLAEKKGKVEKLQEMVRAKTVKAGNDE